MQGPGTILLKRSVLINKQWEKRRKEKKRNNYVRKRSLPRRFQEDSDNQKERIDMIHPQDKGFQDKNQLIGRWVGKWFEYIF